MNPPRRDGFLRSRPPDACGRRGFTLLEILVAVAMLGIVMTSVVATFMVGMQSWKRGQDALDNLNRSTVVGDAILRCLQGIVFSLENPEYYGLYGTDGSDGEYPADEISFVTRSHRLRRDVGQAWKGPRRIRIFMDDSGWGEPALSMSVENPFVLESATEPEVIPLTRYVRGINFRYMDPRTGEWLESWETPEETSADPDAPPLLPGSIEVTLYVANVLPDQPDMVVTRVADLPIARTVVLDSMNRTERMKIAAPRVRRTTPRPPAGGRRPGGERAVKERPQRGAGRTIPVRIGGARGTR